jgi:hypothetical protein
LNLSNIDRLRGPRCSSPFPSSTPDPLAQPRRSWDPRRPYAYNPVFKDRWDPTSRSLRLPENPLFGGWRVLGLPPRPVNDFLSSSTFFRGGAPGNPSLPARVATATPTFPSAGIALPLPLSRRPSTPTCVPIHFVSPASLSPARCTRAPLPSPQLAPTRRRD